MTLDEKYDQRKHWFVVPENKVTDCVGEVIRQQMFYILLTALNSESPRNLNPRQMIRQK